MNTGKVWGKKEKKENPFREKKEMIKDTYEDGSDNFGLNDKYLDDTSSSVSMKKDDVVNKNNSDYYNNDNNNDNDNNNNNNNNNNISNNNNDYCNNDNCNNDNNNNKKMKIIDMRIKSQLKIVKLYKYHITSNSIEITFLNDN